MEEKKELKEKKEQAEKNKTRKDKLMFAGAVVIILIISIATSNINMSDELSSFIKKIWSNGQDAVAESSNVKTLSKGGHVEIVNTQVIHLREIYEVLGNEINEDQAVEILKEVKTLAYYGEKQGISASKKEINDCIADIKKQMKEADESAYRRVVKRYGEEDDYWTTLRDEVEEYVISEKMKDEKEEEFAKKKNVDSAQKLQDYIDEIVGYENFRDEN